MAHDEVFFRHTGSLSGVMLHEVFGEDMKGLDVIKSSASEILLDEVDKNHLQVCAVR